MFAFHVSDLGVGGSRCYNRVNARVERNDGGYAGAEEVLSILRSEDVVAEGRIPAGGVHGSGVLIERGDDCYMKNYHKNSAYSKHRTMPSRTNSSTLLTTYTLRTSKTA